MPSKTMPILRSLCQNYPLLKDWGCSLPGAIALIFSDRRQVMPYIRQLSRQPLIVTEATKVRVARQYLLEANSDGFFLMMPEGEEVKSVKMQEKLSLALDAAEAGEIDGEQTCVAVFVVCLHRLPSDLQERLFVVRVEEAVEQEPRDIYEYIPEDDQLALVKNVLTQQAASSREERALKAAVCCCYPKLQDADVFADFLGVAEELAESAEQYEEAEDISAIAVRRLLDFLWLENGCPIWHELPCLDAEAQADLETAGFFKGDDAFIHERLFRSAMAPLMESVPSTMLKAMLLQAGIIYGKHGDYSSKMNFTDKEGKLRRARMIKMDIRKIVDDAGRSLRGYLLMN